MPRKLETAVLEGFAQDAALQWQLPNVAAPNGSKLWRGGPEWVLQSMYNFHFKDEFDHVLKVMPDALPARLRDDFIKRTKAVFTPRDPKVLESLLAERLALSPGGDHIDGVIGKVEIGRRVVGRRAVLKRRPIVRPKVRGRPDGEWEIVGYREHLKVVREEWPIYMGEGHERAAGRVGPGMADPLPETAEPLSVGALAANFSAEVCIGMLDFLDTSLSEGSTAPTIRGRTGTQPADPDAAESGTLLFTLTMSDPGFAGAVDDTDGTVSMTADTITDDSSADATNTLTYCRAGATGTGADDHLDGSAGTSGADFNYNTVSIVSGSTVSMTSLVIGIDQGSSAT